MVRAEEVEEGDNHREEEEAHENNRDKPDISLSLQVTQKASARN